MDLFFMTDNTKNKTKKKKNPMTTIKLLIEQWAIFQS